MDHHSAHFRLAHELGVSLHELLDWDGPLTHRQAVAWSAWLGRQWNKPTRADYYAMQTAAEVRLCRRSITGGDPVGLNDLKIPFGVGDSSSPQGKVQAEGYVPEGWTQEQEDEFQRQKAEMEKGAMICSLGGKVTHRRITKAQNEEWVRTGVYPEDYEVVE